MLSLLKQWRVTSYIVYTSLVYIEHLLRSVLRGRLHEQIPPCDRGLNATVRIRALPISPVLHTLMVPARSCLICCLDGMRLTRIGNRQQLNLSVIYINVVFGVAWFLFVFLAQCVERLENLAQNDQLSCSCPAPCRYSKYSLKWVTKILVTLCWWTAKCENADVSSEGHSPWATTKSLRKKYLDDDVSILGVCLT